MNRIKILFKYTKRFLTDKKFRDRLSVLMKQNTANKVDAQFLLDEALKSELYGKKIFYIGGCELSFLKEYLDNNIESESIHTFDTGASPHPLYELENEDSELWDFSPDVVVLSHNQQIRSYYQVLQLKDTITFEEQEEQLLEIENTFTNSIQILREKGYKGPIIVMNYPLVYRPALGSFEYHSIKNSYSVIELHNLIRLRFFTIARKDEDTFILDNDGIFLHEGKDQYIRELDADGIYEHVNRQGAVHLGNEVIKTFINYYKIGKKVKCVVVDLDNTMWEGIIQDDGISGVTVHANRLNVLKMLRRRGIVLAIASKNEPEVEPLINELFDKDADIFTVKKISWDDKPNSLVQIADELNIGIDSIAFFDDNPYEREQVNALLPTVRVYPDHMILHALNLPEFDLGVITDESKKRAQMYVEQKERSVAEKSTLLSKDQFLKLTKMKLWLREAKEVDLNRVSEMIQRTNQLNATTIRFTKSEVITFHKSNSHKIYVANLWDKYGEYGLIGLAIVEKMDNNWNLISFLFSCRAMGKTVEQNTLAFIQRMAKKIGIKRIIGKYRETDRNSAIKKIFEDSEFELGSLINGYQEWIYDLDKKDQLKYSEWFEIITKPVK